MQGIQFEQYLSAWGLPDPDLFIRTSGESRISNFFLWQLAYTELYFTKTLWPDFTKEEFDRRIEYGKMVLEKYYDKKIAAEKEAWDLIDKLLNESQAENDRLWAIDEKNKKERYASPISFYSRSKF